MQLDIYLLEKMSQEIPKERICEAENDRLAVAALAYCDGPGTSEDCLRRPSIGSRLRDALSSWMLQLRG